jgi:hypothetical protein
LQTSVAPDTSRTARSAAIVSVVPPDVELLLRADDQVEEVQRRLQLGRHLVGGDEAVLAVAVAGQPPEVRAVVDVERGLHPVRAGNVQRLEDGGFGPRVAEVGPGRHHRARGGHVALVDVILAQRHVRAVVAVEDQRELLLVADAEDHQRGQPLRIGDDAARVDPLLGKLFLDEPAHVLIADAGDERRLQTQPCRAGRHVGGGAADILVEAGHVFETAADLCAVKVHRGPSDRDHVEGFRHVFCLRE